MEEKSYKNTVIFDLDGTLVDTNALYVEAKTSVARIIQQHNPDMPLEKIIDVFDTIDKEAVNTRGFTKNIFRDSAIETYRHLVKDTAAAEEKTVGEIADGVSKNAPKTYKNVTSTLGWLQRKGCTLVLYTEGEREAQQSKLVKTGLGAYFSTVRVVPKKNEAALKELLQEFRKYGESDRVYYVGDSVLKDIAPARACGLTAILIKNGVDTWVDRFDKETTQAPDYTVNNLESVIPIITKENARKD